MEQTADLHSPVMFRRWAGISALAAVLEQKVWVMTSSNIYPNLYVFLTGHPGTGKSRTIMAVRKYLDELPDFKIAPVSMTAASLVDNLLKAKRFIVRLPDPPLEYNSLAVFVDEFGTMMHKYDNEMVSNLSAFYDRNPYGQSRRHSLTDDIKMKSPQLNLLCGIQPSMMMNIFPEISWTQGFTSRLNLVFSDERIIGDDFAPKTANHSPELEHDIRIINSLSGEFEVTNDYREAVNNWRALGEVPVPSHPKLIHYVTRRRAHLYKLSIIAAIDRSNSLILTKDDFNRAMGWMLEAELAMPEVFKAGGAGADGAALDEIKYFIKASQPTDPERGIAEQRIVNFAKSRIPLHSIMRIIDIMQGSGMIRALGIDRKTGQRVFRATEQIED